MKKYIIYFELYDKKMKCTIEASTKEQACMFLKNKIKINKIQLQDNAVDYLSEIFGFNKRG